MSTHKAVTDRPPGAWTVFAITLLTYHRNQEVIEIRSANLFKLITTFLILLVAPIAPAFAFSTLSIQPAGFSSNDKYIDGDAWLLTISDDGNSQYAQGTIEAEDIKSSDGSMAKNDLTIKTEVTEQTCNYQLVQNYNPNLYTFTLEKIGSNLAAWSLDKYLDQCEDKSNFYWVFLKDRGITYDVFCMTRDKVGVPGTIKTPSTNFKSDISVSANGKTETATISSTSTKSVKLGSVAYAHWSGSLTSGEQCPNLGSEGYYIVHNDQGNWVLNKQYLYDTYLDYKSNYFDRTEQEMIDKINNNVRKAVDASLVTQIKDEIGYVNSKANDAMFGFGYKDFKVTKTSLSNGQAQMALDKQIQFPVITMHVKASWLGIVVPVGKPKITSTKSSSFEEGKTGYITVVVKNDGDYTGSFGLAASCQSPFEQVGTALTISNLAAGSSVTKQIPITATTNQDVSKSCTVSVYDLNSPDQKDTETVKVTASPIRLCTPGDERCDGETHKVCNDEGSAWVKTTSDKCKEPECTKNSDCVDADECTKDTCEDGFCKNTYQVSTTCPGEKLCTYNDNGNMVEEYTDAETCCDLQGGRFVPGTTANWWEKLWGEEDVASKCYIPHVSLLGLGLIALGLLLMLIPVSPLFGSLYALIPIGIGVLIQLLAGLGII